MNVFPVPVARVRRSRSRPSAIASSALLMALAIRCDRLIREGEIADYAELARLGHVTRARVTQIMNLLLLAPDIQEAILNLPRISRGDDLIILRRVQAIAAEGDWVRQRELWRRLAAGSTSEMKSNL